MNKSIIAEILEFRKEKLIAGEKPSRIELTDEQKVRLKAWADSQTLRLTAPDGSVRVFYGFDYNSGRIFGMNFTP
jgi:hypothetical protein